MTRDATTKNQIMQIEINRENESLKKSSVAFDAEKFLICLKFHRDSGCQCFSAFSKFTSLKRFMAIYSFPFILATALWVGL